MFYLKFYLEYFYDIAKAIINAGDHADADKPPAHCSCGQTAPNILDVHSPILAHRGSKHAD